MELKKYRWSKVYEAAEEELQQLLKTKNIDAERWEAEPAEVFAPQVYAKDKQLWCAEGSLIFTIDGKRLSIQTGDSLQLPAYTMYEATAGMAGCVCYEFPRTSDNPPEPVN